MSVKKVFALAACLLFSGNALAQLFVAVGNIPQDGETRALGPTDFMLYTIDPASGAIVETIGNTGWPITGLDFHPETGELYASSAYDNFDVVDMGDTEDGEDINRGWLLKVDPDTGAVTPIGQHEDCALVDISFAADGTLFGWRECNDILVTVDLATGATTEIGPDTSTRRQGMDFAPDGRLYQFGEQPGFGQSCGVVEMDPADGELVSFVGFDGCHEFTAGTHDTEGTLWVAERTSQMTRELATLDTATGAVTTVGAMPDLISAIAYRDPALAGPAEPSVPVPVMGLPAIVAMILAMLGLGAWVGRRQRAS